MSAATMNSDLNQNSPLVIDLFSGAGGMTEGFKQAGFQTVLAVEHDLMAAKTFNFNHPLTPLYNGDIKNLALEDIERETRNRPVEIVCGGPPCQGFSLAGQRLADDPRNNLFHEFIRIVTISKPNFFVFENVSGLTSMMGGAILEIILREFKNIGYTCTHGVLNAANFGVPQARPRFIIIGSIAGINVGLPKATHGISLQNELFSNPILPFLTVDDALSDLPIIAQGEGHEKMYNINVPCNDYQKERRGKRIPGTLFNHRATRHSDLVITRYASIPQGGNASQIPFELRTKKINVFKLDSKKPARTVTCNHRTDLLHPIIPRGITVREAARLQSFDDDYCFFGNLTRKAKWVTQDDQVGNAVPPLLAKALANHLAQFAAKSILKEKKYG